MKKLRAMLGALLITASVFSVTACSSSDSDSSSKADNNYEDQTMPPEKKNAILEIVDNDDSGLLKEQELDNKKIKWMATWDINPNNTGKTTPADLLLFQEIYGGEVEYHHVDFAQRFDRLSECISGDEGIDFFYSGDLDAIPRGAIRGMFAPMDDYIDFGSPLWEDVQDANDSIMWKDKHYAAITQTTGDYTAVIYNRKTMQEAGLDDPAVLFENDQWNWDTFQGLLEKFVDTDKQRYGIDGWWFEFGLINTTGVSPISIEDGKLVNNLSDPAIERVQNWMYELYQKNLIAIGGPDYGWEEKPNYIGEGKLLFYPVGLYELYFTPEIWQEKYGKDVFFVPMPRDPDADDYYIPVGMEAYSLVNGADNPEGVARYLDCKRYCLVNEDARAIADTAFTDDYGWTQEMIDMKNAMQEIADRNVSFDISKGVSADCGQIIDENLRLTTRGVPWNETYDSIADVVQGYVDEVNNGSEE